MITLYLEFEPTAAYYDDAKRELFASRLPEARAARIRSPRAPARRAERAAAEACLRRACHAAGESYPTLTVAYTDEGKPYFSARPDLAVSISHTAQLAVVALVKCDDGPAPAVGIDTAAYGTAPADAARLAERFFSATEAEALRSAAPDDSETFLRTWCRMEARVKMTGCGIGDGAQAVEPTVRHDMTHTATGLPRHHVAIALSADADALFYGGSRMR